MTIPEPEPPADMGHNRDAGYKFNREVRQYVLGQLREEWHKHPRSIARCLSLSWGLGLNSYARLLLWTADAVDWLKNPMATPR
jgi:hypothetical protein